MKYRLTCCTKTPMHVCECAMETRKNVGKINNLGFGWVGQKAWCVSR